MAFHCCHLFPCAYRSQNVLRMAKSSLQSHLVLLYSSSSSCPVPFFMSDFNTTRSVVLKSCFHILYSFRLLLLSMSFSIKVIPRQKTCPSLYLSFLCSICTISMMSVFFFRYYTSRRGTCFMFYYFLIFLCIPAPPMFRGVSVFTHFSLSIHF